MKANLDYLERFMTHEGDTIRYTIDILSQDTLEQIVAYVSSNKKVKVIDLTKPGIHQKLLPLIYELSHVRTNIRVELEIGVQERYTRLRDGGYFEKLKAPEAYMKQVLRTSMDVGNNWLVYEDLGQDDVKYIIEVLDYGALITKEDGQGFNVQELSRGKEDIRLRYRKMKTYLTQPKVLHDYLTHNNWDTSKIWDLGYWTWDDLILPEFGLHLPSNELEYYTMELLRGVIDKRYEFT